MKEYIKYGVILIIGYLVLRWGFNAIANLSLGAGAQTGTMYPAPYAPPLSTYQGVYPWIPPQQYRGSRRGWRGR